MKKKKIIGIVLIVIGLFCVFGAFSVNSGAPKTAEVISNAVYVSDGKVLPENEGKAVIVPGMLDAAPFVDQETGIAINSAVAWRHVEKLYIEEETDEDSEVKTEYWSWKTDMCAFGGDKKIVASNVTLGEFTVAEELLQTISATQKRTEYSEKELNQKGWSTFTDDGKTYLYQGNWMPRDEDDLASVNTLLDKNAYREYIGTYRVAYDELDSDPEYTVVALQKDGQLVRIPDVTLQALQSGRLTQAEVLENAESSAKGGMIIAVVGAVLCFGAGAFLIVKKEKTAA